MAGAAVSPAEQPDLALAMEQNLAEHASCLHRGTPGMTVRRTPDLLVADSGLEDDTFNFVGIAAFAPGTAAARIDQTVRELRATGRPFAWRVGPASRPADLRALLATAGVPQVAAEPAMWARLGGIWAEEPRAAETRPAEVRPAEAPQAELRLAEAAQSELRPAEAPQAELRLAEVRPAEIGSAERPPEQPADLDIRLVRSRAELADWSWVLAANWDPPAPTVVDFYAATARRVLAVGCPARYLVGYFGGRPVCSAEVLLHAGVAGLYNVSTLESHQRRGFGTAITATAMHLARQLGASVAVLQASQQGERVYRRLGFRAFGQVAEFPITA